MAANASLSREFMTGYQHILNTPWPSSLDSFEGVPDLFEPRVKPEERGLARRAAHDVLAWAAHVAPGLLMAFVLALLGHWASDGFGRLMRYEKSPVSPILLAVVFGLIVRNVVGVPKGYEAGLRLCIKTILRLGIVLLGLGLSVQAVAKMGLIGLPIIAGCIATALLTVTLLNRALGLPRRLGTLIAVGTSICGVSAIVALAPVIDAEDDETSYAVACITIFGLLALFTYPLLAHQLFETPAQVGLFLGTAVHDTSQVAGAGLTYVQQYGSKEAMDAAIVVKLVRNTSMGLLIPLLAVFYHRSGNAAAATTRRARQKGHQLVPLFVVGFLLMACLRSLGDMDTPRALGVIDRETWRVIVGQAAVIAPWLLAAAMAAVGLGTGLANLRKLGWKPFSVGFTAAAMVGGMSVVLIKLMESLAG